MYRIRIEKKSDEAMEYCFENFGPIGVVVPCHDPMIYKMMRFLFSIGKEPDKAHDSYVIDGRWGNTRWYGNYDPSHEGNTALTSIFCFNSSSDATLFKLTWGGSV